MMSNQRLKFDLLIHDLKVPLAVVEAGIVSLLNRVERYGPLTAKQKKVLDRVLRNTIVTKRLVNDALELGKSRKGIMEKNVFRISHLIEQCVMEIFDLTDNDTAEKIKGCDQLNLLKNILYEKGISLNIDEDHWQKEICLDESKMKQILRNLLNNAIKYRRKQIELGATVLNNELLLSVGDDGDGIPSEFHEKIFECYFQMDVKGDYCVRGHGLGLAGVMILIEDMGGSLSLESDTGRGATFSVKVPF